MSTKKTSRRKPHPIYDREPTPAEIRAARDQAILQGAHARPANRLVDANPANTIENCRRIIDWLAHIEEPFSDGELDVAKADVLHLVVDGLEHVEKQIGGFWAGAANKVVANG
jgi:hypothetical protein